MACACLRSTSWSGWAGAVEGRPNPPGIGGERSSTDLRQERRKRGSALASVGRGPGLRRGFGTVPSTLPPQTPAANGNGSDRERSRQGRPNPAVGTDGEGAADLPRYTGCRHGTHRPSAPMPLYATRHRVELPRPLGRDKIFGECIPGMRQANNGSARRCTRPRRLSAGTGRTCALRQLGRPADDRFDALSV
jgi:hypothetical protein